MAYLGKKLGVLAAQLALASLLAAQAAAYYHEDPSETPFLIKTRVRYWFAATSAQVRSYAETPTTWWIPPTNNIFIGTTEDFKRQNTSFPLYSAEIQPVSGLSLEFETGDNRSSKGQFLQHDWLQAKNKIIYFYDGTTWDSPNHSDYSVARAQTSGTARQYTGNLYLRVYKSRPKYIEDDYELNHTVDLFVGYSWYQNSMRIFNGYQAVSTEFFVYTPPLGPFTGLNSTSKMTWYGWRAGFRDQARLSKDFSAEGKASFGPRLRYNGAEFWNLDTSLADPGIRTKAYGILLELEGSVSWKFWKQFELDAGYLVWQYTAASGEETYYYANGTTLDGKLNRVLATRKGFFTSLSWKY